MRLAAVVVSVGVAASAWAGTALERVEVVRTGPLAVRLHLSAPVTTVARTLPPDGTRPARIYLDLPATSAAGVPAEVAGAETLLRVRAAQFDLSTTRVVLDLASAVPFVLRQDGHPEGRTITIELAPPAAAPVPPPAPAAPQVTAVPESIPATAATIRARPASVASWRRRSRSTSRSASRRSSPATRSTSC